MNESANPVARTAETVARLWPTYAYRGWLTTVLAQALQAEATMKFRLEELEQEAARLRAQLEQTTPAIASLRQSVQAVDGAIARLTEQAAAGSHAADRPDAPQREPDQALETEAPPLPSRAESDPDAGRRKRRT